MNQNVPKKLLKNWRMCYFFIWISIPYSRLFPCHGIWRRSSAIVLRSDPGLVSDLSSAIQFNPNLMQSGQNDDEKRVAFEFFPTQKEGKGQSNPKVPLKITKPIKKGPNVSPCANAIFFLQIHVFFAGFCMLT